MVSRLLGVCLGNGEGAVDSWATVWPLEISRFHEHFNYPLVEHSGEQHKKDRLKIS